MILVKFSSIHKLGTGYNEVGQACESPWYRYQYSALCVAESRPTTVIILDLRTPPSFELESYNGRLPEGIERKWKFKTRDRISAIDPAHAQISPYAHHLRILLADPEDLNKLEKICHVARCEPRPIRVPPIDARAIGFFSHRDTVQVQRWIKTMDWKNAFQIEATSALAFSRPTICFGHSRSPSSKQSKITVLRHRNSCVCSQWSSRCASQTKKFRIVLHACTPSLSVSSHFSSH
jgi:hypothetical protein